MKNQKVNEFQDTLYTASACREIDRQAISSGQFGGHALMARAGQFGFECLVESYPDTDKISILCGTGNNGGDGYIIAMLATQAKFNVKVFAIGLPTTPDAILSRQNAEHAGCKIIDCSGNQDFSKILDSSDVIVDALLGTGVDRNITGYLAQIVMWVNNAHKTILACDIATGLNSDTGIVMGVCIKASLTTTFIAYKAGLFTGEGRQVSGIVRFNNLGVDSGNYRNIKPVAKLISRRSLIILTKPRSETAHKGTTGYAAVIGGGHGMVGAVLLAGKATYRIGCGRVKVLTHSDHASELALWCPELLTMACNNTTNIFSSLSLVNMIAIGPGLGQGLWAINLFNQALQSSLPIVIDADGLNLLAQNADKRDNWVLTPHPGEAARLLDCKVEDIQNNRFAAAKEIVRCYGGVCLLKGSGSVIAAQHTTTRVCNRGNCGQATAGMGDTLTGLIVGLMAQGYGGFEAACLSAWCHGDAANQVAACSGKIGMMASDLLPFIQKTHNELTDDTVA